MQKRYPFYGANCIASLAIQHLGINSSITCLIDEGKSIYIRDVALLLRSLNIENCDAELVITACAGHHRRYGTGAKTLLAMIGFWGRSLHSIVQQGVPVTALALMLPDILKMCINHLHTIRILVMNLSVCHIAKNDMFRQKDNIATGPNSLNNIPNFLCGPVTHGSNSNDPNTKFNATINVSTNLVNSNDQMPKFACLLDSTVGKDDEFDDCFNQMEERTNMPEKKLEAEPQMASVVNVNTDMQINHVQHSDNHKKLSEILLDIQQTKHNTARAFPHQSSRHFRVKEVYSEKTIEKLSDNNSHQSSSSREDRLSLNGLIDTSLGSQGVPEVFCLYDLVNALSHGCSSDTVNFVIDAVMEQNKNTDELDRITWDLVRCHSCVIVGPCKDQSRITSGYVVPIHDDMVSLMHSKKGGRLRALLVNGNITEEAKHIGYKLAVKGKSFCDIEDWKMDLDKNAHWLQQVEMLVTELHLDALLVKGHVDANLMCLCESINVVVMENIDYKILNHLADLHKMDMLCYLLDADQADVCDYLQLQPLNSGEDRSHSAFNAFVSIKCDNVQTLLLCHPCENAAAVQEQEFWQLANRISNVLSEQAALPGGGATEQACCEYLENHHMEKRGTEQHNLHSAYDTPILEAFVEGLTNFYRQVESNVASTKTNIPDSVMSCCGRHGFPSECILDDYMSKAATWRTAMETVMLLLRTDMHISCGEVTTDMSSVYL